MDIMEKHEVWGDEKFFEAGDQEIFGPDLAFRSSLKSASKVTYFC
jgi:hypothetical protein